MFDRFHAAQFAPRVNGRTASDIAGSAFLFLLEKAELSFPTVVNLARSGHPCSTKPKLCQAILFGLPNNLLEKWLRMRYKVYNRINKILRLVRFSEQDVVYIQTGLGD